MASPSPEEKSSVVIEHYNRLFNDMLYTYRAHQKDSSIAKFLANAILWSDIIVTAISFISSINDLIENLTNKTTLKIFTTLFIFTSLALVIINLKMNFTTKSTNHHLTSHEIKGVINHLEKAMRDYRLDNININDFNEKLSIFETEYNDICSRSLRTTWIGYKLACREIKNSGR